MSSPSVHSHGDITNENDDHRPVPTTAAMQAKLVLKLGDLTGITSYWFIPAYTTGSALGFLIAGANSDVFGRRLFLLYGEVMVR
jgi:MFS family permease